MFPPVTKISPLAPKHVPDLPPIAGVRFATADAGIRYKDRTDVLLAVFDKGTTVAGVFTRSKCPSAPVDWCRAKLGQGRARARWWSIPAMPTPSPARPAATPRSHRRLGREGRRLPAGTRCSSPPPA